MFSASWVFHILIQCGHCNNLKPHIEQVTPQLQELGVSVGHVDEKNHELVNQFVVDHKTHMVSYPKLLVFLGDEQMESVPPGLRSAPQILNWFKQTFSLENEELWDDSNIPIYNKNSNEILEKSFIKRRLKTLVFDDIILLRLHHQFLSDQLTKLW